jgi:uncharacterized OB-fold protein
MKPPSVRISDKRLEKTETLASFPNRYHALETAWSKQKTASMECPECGTAVSDDYQFCAECGAELTVCSTCKSINVAFARFCHACGQPRIVESAPNKITKIVTYEAQDFDLLDHAVLAIIKLRGGLISPSEAGAALGVSPDDVSDSIERLELARQIERA